MFQRLLMLIVLVVVAALVLALISREIDRKGTPAVTAPAVNR